MVHLKKIQISLLLLTAALTSQGCRLTSSSDSTGILPFVLSGFQNSIERMGLNEEELQRIEELQNPFGEFYAEIQDKETGERVCIGVKNGLVYRGLVSGNVIYDWEALFRGRSVLTSSRGSWDIYGEGNYIYVFLCRFTIGASGGCQGGGNFRTRNGVDWEILEHHHWRSYEYRNGPEEEPRVNKNYE